jgi:hypothetical protein
MAFWDRLEKVAAIIYDENGNTGSPATIGSVQLSESLVDDAAFTPATSRVVPVGFLADETNPDSVDEGDIGVARMTLSRILWAALRAKNAASSDTELLADAFGSLRSALYKGGDGTAIDAFAAGGDAAGTGMGLLTNSYGYGFNGSSFDRLRTLAASGAGLGVQQVGTLGELITLAASAARTSSANGTAVTGLGWRNRYIILFDLTVADTDAGDTLDVYVDVSLDGSTWLNAVHFTQIIGTDAASKRFAVLDPSAPGTAEILVTADAAAGAVRPSMFGPQMRARWAIVDAGTDDASFTFSVAAYAI